MGNIKLQRRIYLLSKEIKKMRYEIRSLNKLIKKQKSLLDFYDIHCDDNKDDNLLGKNKEKVSKKKFSSPKLEIISDFETNINVSANKRTFTYETLLFSYTLYSLSAQAYRCLRDIFPFPSDSLLRRTFSNTVSELQNKLSDLSKLQQLLIERGLNISDEKIPCTLSVDAFAVNTFKNNNNYAFIYMILPFSTKYRIFPIFLENVSNGNATASTFDLIKKIFQISKNTKFQIKIISVDGDRYYDAHFSVSLSSTHFLNDLFSISLESIFSFFIDFLSYFYSSDFLHLIKNFRSKLLTNMVIINPNSINPINCEEIEKILNLGKALTDRGGLAKLQDCYPIQMFTINNALRIFDNLSSESFFYFLFFGLWTECVLNVKFSIETRRFFFMTLLFISFRFLNFLNTNSLPKTVGFKKNTGLFIFWVSNFKLTRIINTLLVQIFASCSEDETYALDRYSSHPTENFIGIIRELCDGDNRYEVIVHNLARYEFISRNSDYVFVKPKAKRLNKGGCSLHKDGVNFEFSKGPLELSELLYNFIMTQEYDKELMKDFILSLQKISKEAQFKTTNTPNNTSGSQIMSRLLSINKKQTKKNFSEDEIKIIDNYLLSKIDLTTSEHLNFFGCTKEQMTVIIEERKIELSKRPWNLNEDNFLLEHLNDTNKNKTLADQLICRTNKDVSKRKRFLKKKITQNNI